MTLLLLDTNLLVILIVGRTHPGLLRVHKRTKGYGPDDVLLIERLAAGYDGVATTACILSETSSLVRQIAGPARDRIQNTFRMFILSGREQPGDMGRSCLRDEFIELGLTDADILEACRRAGGSGEEIELLTTDEALYNQATARGYPAMLY